ncbi:MAG: hypothetical protein Q9162_003335 [Coniocarpon cinnabarinum]
MSPISGLSTTPHLSVHFRTGSAINAGCAAARSSQSGNTSTTATFGPNSSSNRPNLILELYARVASAVEDGEGLTMILTDLWTIENGPFIRAVFPKEKWKSGLWAEEVKALKEESFTAAKTEPEHMQREAKMVRVLGFMRRKLPSRGGQEVDRGGNNWAGKLSENWEMEVINVWECEWDDVEHVKGIVDAN